VNSVEAMKATVKFREGCLFCRIVRGEVAAHKVFEDEITLAFLDHRPLFPGHSLLIPKSHLETFGDLPAELIKPLFSNVQLLAGAIERGMKAEGSFVAINNRVSQSVPHFHVHIAPRRKGDGLKGFFWPRSKYQSDEEAREVLKAIRGALPQTEAERTSRN
jgi:histidine triad (HIT) family protein